VSRVNGDQLVAQAGPEVALTKIVTRRESKGGMACTRTAQLDEAGRPVLEQWVLHGAGHAWSGGSASGSYTDERGPDASREMIRFFLAHANAKAATRH
jgi:poly(3-hydroxybutyrate) depolymerase